MNAPKRDAVRAELEQRARGLLGESAKPLDYACDWIANGKTLTHLAADLTEALGAEVSRETVRRALAVDEAHGAVEQKLREARAEGATALADEARAIVDQVEVNRDAIAKAKLRADVRTWTAERWNREMYGGHKPTVQISLGELHIDAMRQRALSHPPRAQLPTATAEVVRVEETELADEGSS